MTPAEFESGYAVTPQAMLQAVRDVVAHALRLGVGPAARGRIGSAVAEILDNVLRHSHASSVSVVARMQDGAFVVSVRDDGAGFAVSTVDRFSRERNCANGLQRALALAEDVHVESAVGAGTRVTLGFQPWRVSFDECGAIDTSELDFFSPEVSRRVLATLYEHPDLDTLRLSPALAVVVGRLLCGPEPRLRLETALWS